MTFGVGRSCSTLVLHADSSSSKQVNLQGAFIVILQDNFFVFVLVTLVRPHAGMGCEWQRDSGRRSPATKFS